MFAWLGIQRGVRVRRLISLLVLVSFCASFVPLPVASRSSIEKDQSTPFPCQNRPCGCRSAEACWKSCCCFTNREKLAWAKANRVVPPTYVIAAAAQESAEAVCQSGGCCSKHKPATMQKNVVTDLKAKRCCSSSGDTHSDKVSTSKTVSKTADDEDETVFVIGVLVQKCQGQGLFWNSLPWAILPEVQAIVTSADPVLWARPTSMIAPVRAVEPPEPPPRVVIAGITIA